MIEQLPILNMLVFLIAALIIPLFSKKAFFITLILGFFVLLSVFVSSIILLVHVNTVGEFYYRFGNYQSFLGIEFKIDAF